MILSLKGLLVVAALVGGFLLAVSSAQSHSWYDPYCCNGSDCAPIDDARVKLTPDGYIIDGKHFVAKKDVRPGRDDQYHACFWPSPDTLRCFYIPNFGS